MARPSPRRARDLPSRRPSPTPGTARPATSTIRTPGCATATTPTRSPTSRPRTPTRRRGSTTTPALVDDALRARSSRASRRPTSRCRCAHGPWWYVTRTVEGQSYPVFCRGRTIDDGRPTVHPRLNVEAAGHDFFDVHAVDPSPDHSPAGVVERPRRRRALHAAGPRPRDRRRARRRADRHVVVGRRGVVERRAVAVLRPPRRPDAPARDLAPPPRHAASTTTCWCSSEPDERFNLDVVADAQRAVDRHLRPTAGRRRRSR